MEEPKDLKLRGRAYHGSIRCPRSREKQFRALIRDLRRAIKDFPGLWIEDKRWTFCIHFRQARRRDEPRVRLFLRRICNQARRMGVKAQEGTGKVIEFYSDTQWNKGQAALWMKRRCRAAVVFYVGDDATDETVFRALGRAGVTIRVGRFRASKALYYLKRQSDSEKLLKRIVTL